MKEGDASRAPVAEDVSAQTGGDGKRWRRRNEGGRRGIGPSRERLHSECTDRRWSEAAWGVSVYGGVTWEGGGMGVRWRGGVARVRRLEKIGGVHGCTSWVLR